MTTQNPSLHLMDDLVCTTRKASLSNNKPSWVFVLHIASTLYTIHLWSSLSQLWFKLLWIRQALPSWDGVHPETGLQVPHLALSITSLPWAFPGRISLDWHVWINFVFLETAICPYGKPISTKANFVRNMPSRANKIFWCKKSLSAIEGGVV